MRKIFLAFPSYKVKIRGKRKKIGDFEFWNLDKINRNEFINLIEKEIKPSNKNVKRNNHAWLDEDNPYKDMYQSCYDNSVWGILLPDYSKDKLDSKYESSLIINLFSDLSLPIMFSVASGGITIYKSKLDDLEKSKFHSEDKKFTNIKFTEFYKLLTPEVMGINWRADEVLKWDREQWRLSIACLLFSELEQYQRSKDVMTWQKECAEIVTLYETLLSRCKNDNGRHKIVQRVEILLAEHYKKSFPKIKKNLKTLFDYRNEFVHGGFFDRLKKATKPYPNDTLAQLPNVDFQFLEEQTAVLRKTLVLFIFLRKKFKKSKKYAGLSVPEIINMGIMNIATRKKIREYANQILKLTYDK